jgi:hypothetical protein
MDKKVKYKLIGTLIVPIGLAIVFIPYSIFVGWNLFTLILFWFVFTPLLAAFLPTLFLKIGNHFIESILGLIIFYAIMVFLIYDHYKTDTFKIMILSFAINFILILMISRIRRQSIQTYQEQK